MNFSDSKSVGCIDPACTVEATDYLRLADDDQVLIGGTPSTVVRLKPSGATICRKWLSGQPIGRTANEQRLARRLEVAGLIHIRWPKPPDDERLTCDVVIPVHNDADGLESTLRSLRSAAGQIGRVIVVDDGSTSPIDHLLPLFPGPTILIRHGHSLGPAAARQLGLTKVTGRLVLCLDAGTTVEDDAVKRLQDSFIDPVVVAAAPRIRSVPGSGLVARYEAARSPLDLGVQESLVGPGRLVPYVPTACLMMRTGAVRSIQGFDQTLRFGEDVDLIWRLIDSGTIKYLPEIAAWHAPRPGLVAMFHQRVGYHSAATPLAARHGHKSLAPSRQSWWSAGAFGLVLAGHSALGFLVAGYSCRALNQRLSGLPDQRVEAAMGTVRHHRFAATSAASAALRAWLPGLLALLLFPGPHRPAIARLLGLGVVRRLADQRPHARPGLQDYLVDLGVGVVDDVAACWGLWYGGWKHRRLPPVAPTVAPWPPRRPGLKKD